MLEGDTVCLVQTLYTLWIFGADVDWLTRKWRVGS